MHAARSQTLAQRWVGARRGEREVDEDEAPCVEIPEKSYSSIRWAEPADCARFYQYKTICSPAHTPRASGDGWIRSERSEVLANQRKPWQQSPIHGAERGSTIYAMQRTTQPAHTPKGLTCPCPVSPSNTKKLRTGSSLPPIAFRASCPRMPPTMAQLGAYSNPCTVAMRLGMKKGDQFRVLRNGYRSKRERVAKRVGTHSISFVGNNSTDTPNPGSSF